MEEHKSTAGQGLGIAGLVMGILAIPMGIIPCTFYIGIIFGLIGIILSIVAFSQANRANGPKGFIIAALVCSIIGLTFASAWFIGGKYFRTFVKDGRLDETINEIRGDMEQDFETDTADYTKHASGDLDELTDSLKALEGEESNP